MRDEPHICVSRRAADELKSGFPWVYDNEILSGDPVEDGAVCIAVTEKGRYLATGFWNSSSKLRFRVLTTNANDRVDAEFWKRKIRWAIEYRMRVMGKDFRCCRILFGDADGFPGVTVDRYEDVLSVEISCLGMELRKELLFAQLLDAFTEIGEPVSAILERSEGKLRALEGMQDTVGFVRLPGYELAEKDTVCISENGLIYRVDVVNGQKTGYFLDQKYNRAAAARLAPGLRVLDCCTHTGGFALNCAAAGAKSVLGIDISGTAVAQCRENAQLNGLENIRFEEHDVFRFLQDTLTSGEKPWDMIILDPPAFTKSRSTVRNAGKGYEELNLLAMRLLPRGGYLVTCSCSRFMTPDLFLKAVSDAAYKAGVSLRLIEKRGASPDHPDRIGAPDTEYLKCLLFQVV